MHAIHGNLRDIGPKLHAGQFFCACQYFAVQDHSFRFSDGGIQTMMCERVGYAFAEAVRQEMSPGLTPPSLAGGSLLWVHTGERPWSLTDRQGTLAASVAVSMPASGMLRRMEERRPSDLAARGTDTAASELHAALPTASGLFASVQETDVAPLLSTSASGALGAASYTDSELAPLTLDMAERKAANMAYERRNRRRFSETIRARPRLYIEAIGPDNMPTVVLVEGYARVVLEKPVTRQEDMLAVHLSPWNSEYFEVAIARRRQ